MKNFWLRGYYSYLLILFFLVFAFRPYNSSFTYIAWWKALANITFLASIFNVKHHRGVKVFSFILAVPTLAMSWVELLYPTDTNIIIFTTLAIAFMAIAATSTIYDVILRARVTLETLRGVVCAYFIVAFTFAYIYLLIEFLIPGSFHLIEHDTSFLAYSRNLSQFIYFSFITLLTIGFGDISPLMDVSQTFTVLEGIIGQFYIAILVSRIVAVYSLKTIQKK
jgi:hypothetical protein